MSVLLLALVIAAIACGVAWRRPDARAGMLGAWQAGKAQAIHEFRTGYQYAQQRLRAGNPAWWNPRRWASWLLAAAYGITKTIAAANRVRAAAWRGARDRYAEHKAAQPVPADEVVETIDITPDPAEPAPDPQPEPGQPQPQPAASPPTPEPGPTPEPHTEQEGHPVQTEAAGLTSYATAHQQFAVDLRAQMGGSENLAASMAGILAAHSDLIGDTALLQDHLNQAAAIADRIAQRSLAVANN